MFDAITSATEKQESCSLTQGWRLIVCDSEEETVFSFQRKWRNFLVLLSAELFLEELWLSQGVKGRKQSALGGGSNIRRAVCYG